MSKSNGIWPFPHKHGQMRPETPTQNHIVWRGLTATPSLQSPTLLGAKTGPICLALSMTTAIRTVTRTSVFILTCSEAAWILLNQTGNCAFFLVFFFLAFTKYRDYGSWDWLSTGRRIACLCRHGVPISDQDGVNSTDRTKVACSGRSSRLQINC